MSTFKCEVVRIEEIIPHPNADRLDLARIRGWRAVTQKGLHQAGDLVVYIPEDAILPEPILEAMNLGGKLAGKNKNRVKAIRLRGELSQGVVMPVATAERIIRDSGRFSFHATEGDDLTQFLGVTKYEEPIPIHMAGEVVSRPAWMIKYTDIENVKNFPHALRCGEEVIFTEKLHGACMSVGAARGEDQVYVSSRNLCLAENDANSYWKAAKAYGIPALLKRVLADLDAQHVILFGELLGVQDLKYGFNNGHLGFRWFDLLVDGEYVSYSVANEILSDVPQVPVLYRGPFSESVMMEHTDGNTTLDGVQHIREGIVMRPVIERYDFESNLGRVLLKSISADYLTRKGGTELH